MKKILLAALLALVPLSSLAVTRVGALGAQFDLNRASPEAMRKHRLGDKLQGETERFLRAKYDFTVQGGAVAALTLRDVSTNKAAVLPKGAIVRDCLIDVVTAPTSGGSATIALGTGQAANDLKAATAIASYTGLVACVPVGTAATAIKLTADQTMTATVATAALTAGKIYVIVQYELSDTQ